MALPINIEQLLRGKVVEWERLDFKRSWNPEDVLHTMCAFANDIHNWGGGYIIIGIEEQNGMPILPPYGIPLKELDGIQKELVNLCNMIQPVVNILCEPVEIDGQMILIIWVPGGDVRPYKASMKIGKESQSLGKRYYVRQGSVTRIANVQEEQQLMKLCNKIPFDDRVCHQATLADLDRLLIEDFLHRVGSKIDDSAIRNLPFEQLCWNMQIIGGAPEDIHPKNVGILFFSREPERYIPYARIEIVHFHDDIGDHFDEKVFHGPIHLQLEEALDYIQNKVIIEKVMKIPNQARAMRAYNYPYGALEEVISNAVFHKSWDDRNPIEIRINHDSIQVYNLEGPMPPISNSDLQRECIVNRNYRNRRIGDFLKELDMTEGRSTGFPKIYRELRRNGSPLPAFETNEYNQYFLATIKIHPAFLDDKTHEKSKDVTQNVTQNVTQTDASSSIPRELKVLNYILSNPKISALEIANELGVTRRTIHRDINLLRKQYEINWIGSAKTGHWEVKTR